MEDTQTKYFNKEEYMNFLKEHKDLPWRPLKVDFEEQRREFFHFVMDKTEERAFNLLNVEMMHTVPQLAALMRYKARNAKVNVHPSIFFEVAEMLESQENKLSKHRWAYDSVTDNNKVTVDDMIEFCQKLKVEGKGDYTFNMDGYFDIDFDVEDDRKSIRMF